MNWSTQNVCARERGEGKGNGRQEQERKGSMRASGELEYLLALGARLQPAVFVPLRP